MCECWPHYFGESLKSTTCAQIRGWSQYRIQQGYHSQNDCNQYKIIVWPDQWTAVLIISPEESKAIILTFDSSKYLLMIFLIIISLYQLMFFNIHIVLLKSFLLRQGLPLYTELSLKTLFVLLS